MEGLPPHFVPFRTIPSKALSLSDFDYIAGFRRQSAVVAALILAPAPCLDVPDEWDGRYRSFCW